MAPPPLVLITGITGFIGFRTLLETLKHGYRVRAAVRDLSKSQSILANQHLRSLNLPEDTLSFIAVPDITAPSAYTNAVQDVDFIIHLAAPLATGGRPGESLEDSIVKPTVQGAMGMLNAAADSPSVRRVVITNSVFGIVPYENMSSAASSHVFDAETRQPDPTGPYANGLAAYGASKIAALNKAEAWVAGVRPRFDVVHVHPNYVLGRNYLAASAEEARRGTNNNVLSLVLGQKKDGLLAGGCVHVLDVAMTHVLALDTAKVAGNQSLIANVECEWNEVTAVVSKRFPGAVESGVLPNDGAHKTLPVRIDATKTEERLGFQFRSFEEQVKETVGFYLDLKQGSV